MQRASHSMQKISLLLLISAALPGALFAGGWSQKSGAVRLKLSFFSLVTDSRYATGGGLESRCLVDPSPDCFLHPLESGATVPVFSDLDGEAVSRAVFLTTVIGLPKRFELSAQLGWFNSDNDFAATVPPDIPTGATGLSDLWLELKYQFLQRGGLAAALTAGYKTPTGKFSRNAFGVSLGEGNHDYELKADLGLSLWPLPLYANLMLGYRWRGRNNADFDYGDEVLYSAEAGVNLQRNLLLKIAVHGLNAADDEQLLGIGQPFTPGRQVTFLSPTLFYTFATVTLEAGVEHSLTGRNYIRGTKLNLGLTKTFNLL